MSRLIDADELKRMWYEEMDITEEDRGAVFIGYTQITRLIDSAPTVDAVRHGKWEIWSSPFSDDGAVDMIKCSECGYAPVWDSKEGKPNYCPNCGTRMDKE